MNATRGALLALLVTAAGLSAAPPESPLID